MMWIGPISKKWKDHGNKNFDATAVIEQIYIKMGWMTLFSAPVATSKQTSHSLLFVQILADGTWTSVNLPNDKKYIWNQRNMQDGVPDIVIAKSGEWKGGFFIFKGSN